MRSIQIGRTTLVPGELPLELQMEAGGHCKIALKRGDLAKNVTRIDDGPKSPLYAVVIRKKLEQKIGALLSIWFSQLVELSNYARQQIVGQSSSRFSHKT